MHFVFYPRHEFGCPHVGHCPHLGGASLGWLVQAADEQTEWTDSLLRQIDALRAEGTAKYHKIQERTAQVEQLQRELKAERQKQFQRKREQTAEESPAESPPPGPRKHGAPVGHPGWYRQRPVEFDEACGSFFWPSSRCRPIGRCVRCMRGLETRGSVVSSPRSVWQKSIITTASIVRCFDCRSRLRSRSERGHLP